MQLVFSSLFASTLLFLSISALAQNDGPTCDSPVGTWQNDLGSVLVIEAVDAETGMVSGAYQSASGTAAKRYPLTGWTNDAEVDENSACKDCKQNHAQVFAFTVSWGDIGSVTAWTGTCALVDGQPTLNTVWNLARPNSNYSWDHVNSGSASFVPKE